MVFINSSVCGGQSKRNRKKAVRDGVENRLNRALNENRAPQKPVSVLDKKKMVQFLNVKAGFLENVMASEGGRLKTYHEGELAVIRQIRDKIMFGGFDA